MLSASSVVAGSVTVTDGNYTWDQTNGSSNENDFGVSYNSGLRRVTVNYYNGAAAGKTIFATYRTPSAGFSGAIGDGGQPWLETAINGTAQTPRLKLLTVPFASRSKIADSVSSENPKTQTDVKNLSNLIQRVNLTGVPMPGHYADSTSGGSVSGINSSFLEGSSATWLSASKKYSSTILLNPPTSNFGWVGAWGWAVMARTSVNAQVSRITGTMSLSNTYYNNAEIRFVYSDNSTQSFSRGSGSFDITNPSPNKPVKSVEYYGGTSSSQAQGATISGFVSYPVSNQKRFVDINLLSQGIIASNICLVTDNIEPQKITFQVQSGSWTSQEFNSSQDIQIPSQTPISGLRIFLNYTPSSASFDGAELQSYSLKYW